MIIEKPTIERIVAFTLAEVLVTMIIIVLMTLASIPVIKKSKEYRDAAKDRNTWMAFYDQNDELKVYVDGSERSDLVEGSGDDAYAKFEPPEGVTRFNVTVIGGGGGGAAGEAGIGQVKAFKADPNLTEQTYVASDTGLYQIVAVGGGGGGGGGGMMCEGGGAYSGAVKVAQVMLEKGEICNVVGIGGKGGQRQSIGDVFLDATLGFVTIGLYYHFKNPKRIRHEYGESFFEDLIFNTQPTHRKQGGGNGTPSIFKSENATIRAAGGGGGAHERKKFLRGCKPVGGCRGEANHGTECENVSKIENDVKKPFKTFAINHVDTRVEGDAKEIYELEPQVPRKEAKIKVWGEIRTRTPGVISEPQDEAGTVYQYASTEVEEHLKDFPRYGNGGLGGHRHRTGYEGSDGIVLIQELPVFGGGAGSPGAISFFSYTKSPLSTKQEKEDGFVKVYPGKGGKGALDSGQAGEDGQFSRFGTRIIADGGKGGKPRASNPADEEKEDEIKAPGENGILAAIQKTLKEKIVYPSGAEKIEEIFGGLQEGHSGSCINPEGVNPSNANYYNNKYNGYGMKSCKANYFPLPGSGGAGGGAQGSRSFNTGEIGWGVGGNGAHGIVIVTW